MPIKVYIEMLGNDKMKMGTYEINEFPVKQDSGLLSVIYTPEKGIKKGMRKAMQLSINNIARIEPVDDDNPNYSDLPNE